MINMKRILVLLLIMMLTKTIYSSATTLNYIEQDSTVLITYDQLKQANLIFVEHSKLLEENRLLNQQIINYIDMNNYLSEIDTLRVQQLNNLKDINFQYLNKIEDLNKTISKNKTTINVLKVGCFSVSLGFLLYILFK